jgi:hypothetical protein
MYITIKHKERNMQNVHVLQLQGTGDDEYAWENAGVFVDYDEAVKKLADINGEYERDEALFTLGDTARIEVHELVDSNWGY